MTRTQTERWQKHLCSRCGEKLPETTAKGGLCSECNELITLRKKTSKKQPVNPREAHWEHPGRAPRLTGNWAEVHEQNH
jgi:predicted RNA-binding Zn-ribbon protein involved in translation (DUF1610 family)